MKNNVLILLLLASGGVFGQDKNRGAFFELGGPGGFGSFNYERFWEQSEPFKIGYRAGISGVYSDPNSGFLFLFPVNFKAVYGANKHKLVGGIGNMFSITTKGGLFMRGFAEIGYRCEKSNGKLFLEFKYTPYFSYLLDVQYQHWGAGVIGFRF